MHHGSSFGDGEHPYTLNTEGTGRLREDPGKLDYGHRTSGRVAIRRFMPGTGGPMMTDIWAARSDDSSSRTWRCSCVRADGCRWRCQHNVTHCGRTDCGRVGLQGFEALSWMGISAPKGTPQPMSRDSMRMF
jgi:hypothetical protein